MKKKNIPHESILRLLRVAKTEMEKADSCGFNYAKELIHLRQVASAISTARIFVETVALIDESRALIMQAHLGEKRDDRDR